MHPCLRVLPTLPRCLLKIQVFLKHAVLRAGLRCNLTGQLPGFCSKGGFLQLINLLWHLHTTQVKKSYRFIPAINSAVLNCLTLSVGHSHHAAEGNNPILLHWPENDYSFTTNNALLFIHLCWWRVETGRTIKWSFIRWVVLRSTKRVPVTFGTFLFGEVLWDLFNVKYVPWLNNVWGNIGRWMLDDKPITIGAGPTNTLRFHTVIYSFEIWKTAV